MKSNEVFIKAERPEESSSLLAEVSESLEEASQIINTIEELQSKEKELVERWQKEINLANLSVLSAQDLLPQK
jgi:hypothetical protein